MLYVEHLVLFVAARSDYKSHAVSFLETDRLSK